MPNPYHTLLSAAHLVGLTELLLWARRRETTLTVLHYQGVRPATEDPFDPGRERFVTPQAFRQHLRFIKRHFTVLALHEAVSLLQEEHGPGPLAAITFDDGDALLLTEALPILQSEQVPFTIFVPTGLLNGELDPWWVRLSEAVQECAQSIVVDLGGQARRYDLRQPMAKWRLYRQAFALGLRAPDGQCERTVEPVLAQLGRDGAPPHPRALLSWKELKLLVRSPLADLGSHTVHHWMTSRLAPKALRQEVLESKRQIEEQVGVRVLAFGYPYGEAEHDSPRLRDYLAEGQYRCAVTGEEGVNRRTQNPFALRRVSITGADSWPVFAAKVVGVDAMLKKPV